MSEKNVLKGMKVKACGLSDAKSVTSHAGEPPVFYRRPCSECEKDAIDLIESGVSMRSPVLGITSDGEIGCSRTELEGDYELGIYCRHCGHEVCRALSETGEVGDEFLSEWAKSAIEVRTAPPFVCPKCHSKELQQLEVGIEFSHAVVAVCESDAPDSTPLVAVSHLRETQGRGTYRYRCSQNHELANDDGTPVETAEDLVAWLKAQTGAVES